MGNPKAFPFIMKTVNAVVLNKKPTPDNIVSMVSKMVTPNNLRNKYLTDNSDSEQMTKREQS